MKNPGKSFQGGTIGTIIAGILTMLCLLLTACPGLEDPAFTAVTDITNVPTEATVGVSLSLTGMVTPADATNKTITWSVKEAGTTGAAITSENRLTAAASGIVTITATILNGTANGTSFVQDFYITVTASNGFVAVTDITNVPDKAIVETPLTLTGTVTPASATNKVITWSVTDAGTTGAAINNENRLTATASGTVKVTASITNGIAEGHSYTQDFTITVITADQFIPVTDITNVPTEATVGVPLSLTGMVTPADASSKTITWTVKNAADTGATINNSHLTATAEGEVVITATIANGKTTSEDFTKDFTITVSLPVLSGFVSIGGITQTGETLTANPGLTGGGTISYQWKRGNENITDATASTYILTAADEGSYIQVTVTMTGYSGSITSAPTAAITKAPDPSTSGSVDGTISVNNGINNVEVSFSNTGSISVTADGSLTLTVQSTYQAYRWFVDNKELPETSGSLLINGADYAAGSYRILVIAYKNGIPYSREIQFSVNSEGAI